MTRVVRVLAPNPGVFTLEGTNTWIVGERPSVVIDPGPADEGHLAEVARTAGGVGAILLTHHHPDHAPGAAALALETGAAVWALRPSEDERPLADGHVVPAGNAALEVVATPGHSADHCVFFEPEGRALFTGDAVLGRGTSVIDPPDGDLALYLGSLRRMLDLGAATIYPGHGPAVWSAADKLRDYLEHRAQREREILEALREGPSTPEDIVPRVYAGYSASVLPVAARSVLAHLIKLERDGRVRTVERSGETAFALADVGPAPRTT